MPDLMVNRKLRDAALAAFKVIDSSLATYFLGDTHMYKPIAGQLRLLFCDTMRNKDHSLLVRIEPDIELLAFREIKFCGSGALKFAPMPFEVTRRANGVQYCRLDVNVPHRFVKLVQWREQTISLNPTSLTVNDVVRSVADKDGGAHVDSVDSPMLAAMRRPFPVGLGSNVVLTIGLGLYAQRIGRELAAIWSQDDAGLLMPVSSQNRNNP